MSRLCASCLCLSILAAAAGAGRAAGDGLALQQYAHVDFPRRIQAANDAIALAELNVAYWQERVAGYRVFRRFGAYAATFSADRFAQMQLLAAQQELACLLLEKGDLWRERQAVARAALFEAARDQKSQPR